MPVEEEGAFIAVAVAVEDEIHAVIFQDGHYGLSGTFTASMKLDPGDGRVDGNGAYHKSGGNVPHQGAVYAVGGSSGHAGGGSYNHPAMYRSLPVVGSLVIDIATNRLDLAFLQFDATVGDHFTLIKDAPAGDVVPPGPVTNLIVTAATTNSATLSWTAPGDDDYTGTAAGYDVRYGTNQSDVANWLAATQISIGLLVPRSDVAVSRQMK